MSEWMRTGYIWWMWSAGGNICMVEWVKDGIVSYKPNMVHPGDGL